MEIVLLIVLIVAFIISINKLSKKIDRLQDSFFEVNLKLDHYKKLAENADKSPTTSPTTSPVAPAPAAPPKPVQPVNPVTPATPGVPVPDRPGVPMPAAPEVKIPKPAEPLPRVASIQAPDTAPQPRIPLPPQKSWWENFKEQNPDLEKFIGENLINKIGILILVLGISYFVKFAIDKDWINEPARVGIGILAGGIVMLVAHKLRINYKAFSSVLVAGAISIFYFTITVAFHDYGLFSQTVAFIIMVVITGFSAFISVNYNRMELAVLSLIGGFAAPFMVSTGSGNYVVLFTYIAILNVGILSIAYYKKWALINAMAYAFTVLLYGAWLFDIDSTIHPPYTGALVFGFVFYLIFIVMNIINNIRNRSAFTNMELTILVSNTFLFYGSGMFVLNMILPQYQGLFTLLLGLFNFCFAWLLYKKLAMDQKIIYILIGLTLTFVTLTIPIQFEGNYITLFWAAEAILLMWLAQKSKIQNFRFGSVIVHALMLISLIMDWAKLYNGSVLLTAVINPAFLTGLFAVGSCIGVVFLLKKDIENYTIYGIVFNTKKYSAFAQVVTILLAYVAGVLELNYQAEYYLESSYAVYSLILLYHLVFSILFIQLYCKGKDAKTQAFGSVLGIINIVTFILLFSQLAYYEVEEYLLSQIASKFAYWLHFVLLAAVAYTVILLYKINRDKITAQLTGNGLLPWVGVFLLVYLTSSELMLHWLVISLNPQPIVGTYVTVADMDNINVMRNQVIKTGFPVLWGLLACGLLLTGIKKQLKNIRITALVLLGLTIVKLFVYDIRNASETGKIIAFILLGVLILVISFVYQKLKLLVIQDKLTNDSANQKNADNETI
ncbi:DUF2339 domain-containing protein [Flavobacterium subsaxonicum]|uniref:Membrane protein n=1 Tax=Flavobacterium subsaxonicum WB 4.1-42 = DSM 21790 TaxID=1121898 RepID=A0A0A2MHZ4_9FLAO|nr:DUF2339 domain-containing protein [Flavobacterium subsaxonicum]KGO91181.1 membrane protein [Flavobacterium subsaxonicum WB 4.1-42 = DSM 21790]